MRNGGWFVYSVVQLGTHREIQIAQPPKSSNLIVSTVLKNALSEIVVHIWETRPPGEGNEARKEEKEY